MPLLKGDTTISRPHGMGYEIFGNRAYIKDGWKIVSTIPPLGDSAWELYHLAMDPYERNNLANEQPDKLMELTTLWERYAKETGIVYDPIQLRPGSGKK